uniref:DNA-directed DNA polymerase n=1 Tax=Romanomermis culicivorax TaxID=13658 RepID=A0A915KBF4_ROMCU
MIQAGLANYQGSCGFYHWEKLQTVLLPNYQIKIFSKEQFKDLIFRRHLCFMQSVGNEEVEEEDVFETNDEAFFGGHTNAIKLYHKMYYNEDGTPLEKINYVDVCSLYPVINKCGKYPTVLLYDNVEQYHPTRNPDGGFFAQYVNTSVEMKLKNQ